MVLSNTQLAALVINIFILLCFLHRVDAVSSTSGHFLDSLTVSCSRVVSVCIRVLPTPWSGQRVHNSIPNVCICMLAWDGLKEVDSWIYVKKSFWEMEGTGSWDHVSSILGRSTFIPAPSTVHPRRPLIGWGHTGWQRILKGVWHEIFDFRFFNESVSSGPMSIPLGRFEFFRKFAEIFSNECSSPAINPCHGFSVIAVVVDTLIKKKI